MRLALLIVLLPILAARPAAAACPGETQSDMNLCAGKAWREADAKLNAAYQAIIGRLRQNAGTRSKLVAAERAWLSFRDAECAFAAAGVAGGSVAPMIELDCRTGLTQQRLHDLDRYLACQEGDMSCPVPHA